MVSDCEELVGVSHTNLLHPLNSLAEVRILRDTASYRTLG